MNKLQLERRLRRLEEQVGVKATKTSVKESDSSVLEQVFKNWINSVYKQKREYPSYAHFQRNFNLSRKETEYYVEKFDLTLNDEELLKTSDSNSWHPTGRYR